MPLNTCGRLSRDINWLFLDPSNARSRIHSMTISLDTALEQLPWVAAIKIKFKLQVHEAAVDFWMPSPSLSKKDIGTNWVRSHPNVKEVARFCQPTFLVGNLFDSWDDNHVHFLITIEDDSDAAKERCHVPESPLHVMHRRFHAERISLSRQCAQLQKDSKTAVYDGLYAQTKGQDPTPATMALPVTILHPVFQGFLDRIDNPAFEPGRGIVPIVSKLISTASQIYPSEEVLAGLCGYMEQAVPTGTCILDGTISKKLGGCFVPLLCTEYKPGIDEEGGYDPSTQDAYPVRASLVSKEFTDVLERCCCPSFLLSGAGPYLCILGIVFTDKLIVQRLTDIMWVGRATYLEGSHIYRLARIFESLRFALAELDGYYSRVLQDPNIPALILNEPHPRFFPYPTKFREYCAEANGAVTEFEYINASCMDPTNVSFTARVKSSGQKLFIRFVEKYGAAAHQLLANAGMAPRLLYCGLPDGTDDVRRVGSRALGRIREYGLYEGPIRMVVMQHVEGKTMDKVSPPPENACDQTWKAIMELHSAGMVFGDLQGPNVLVSGEKIFLTKFDWAGREGEAYYPGDLSREVNWPEKVEELELEPILMVHDRFMLSQLFPSECSLADNQMKMLY